MRWLALVLVLVLVLACAPAGADILLRGSQHIGDNEGAAFTPSDPVTRTQMQNFPTRFFLSEAATITAVRFDSPVPAVFTLLALRIDGSARSGTLVGNLFTFLTPVSLSAGLHTLAPDPGCLNSLGVQATCPATTENDIGFASLTLISTATTTARMLTRRQHIGDDNDTFNDNYGGLYYPDLLLPPPADLRADMSFSIDVNRVLNRVDLFRLRDVNTVAGSHAQILVDGVQVGVLSGDGDALQVGVLRALPAGSHTLSIVAGIIDPTNRDTISWDDIILHFSAPIGGIPGRFNAVDSGGDGLSGPLRTHVAGSAFTLDVVAINTAGTSLQTDYTGTVSVELLDASNDSGSANEYGCRSSWSAVQNLGALTYVTANGGRLPLGVNHPDALRVARVRITDAATGISGCSIDAFAIRPASFSVLVTHQNATTAGTGAQLDQTGSGGNRVHRAGQPFTVRTTARNSGGAVTSGYVGTNPTLSVQSTILGAVAGSVSAGNWLVTGGGERRTDTALYSEAGTFNLAASDADFASVDAADTPLADREVRSTVGVGRFIPDHFRLVSRNTPTFAPGCGSFTYVGQPFIYATPPEAILEAVNASGGRTLNYEDPLYKLAAASGRSTYNGPAGVSLDLGLVPSPDRSLASAGPGLIRMAYRADASFAVLRGGPVEPFNLELEVVPPALSESDGVLYADPLVPVLTFGGTAAGTGIAFTGAAKQQRFGQLFLRNGYGSELLPLDLVYGVEAVGVNGGFARNLADSCSVAGAVTLGTEPLAAQTSVVGAPSALVAGQGTLRLAAPGTGNTGAVSVQLDGAAWLRTDRDGNGVYGETALGVATFGRFREADRQIYLRETYR